MRAYANAVNVRESGDLDQGFIWNFSAAWRGGHSLKRLSNGVGNSLTGRPERVGAQMSVALRRGRVLMPEKRADDGQAGSACHSHAGKAVAQVEASEALQARGFQHVQHFARAPGKAGGTTAARSALVADLMKAHIWKSHAEIYADRLSKGGSMVIVHAPFGSALKAMKVMDKHDPVDSGIAETPAKPDFKWDDAAPLSSILQLPVLSQIEHPAETLTGIPSLTKGAAYLSSCLGLPVLSAGLAHATTSMGFPLLSSSATPLSSAIGMNTLSQNATPLSSMFGLPTLK